jgi:hypothetical protein
MKLSELSIGDIFNFYHESNSISFNENYKIYSIGSDSIQAKNLAYVNDKITTIFSEDDLQYCKLINHLKEFI